MVGFDYWYPYKNIIAVATNFEHQGKYCSC